MDIVLSSATICGVIYLTDIMEKLNSHTITMPQAWLCIFKSLSYAATDNKRHK